MLFNHMGRWKVETQQKHPEQKYAMGFFQPDCCTGNKTRLSPLNWFRSRAYFLCGTCSGSLVLKQHTQLSRGFRTELSKSSLFHHKLSPSDHQVVLCWLVECTTMSSVRFQNSNDCDVPHLIAEDVCCHQQTCYIAYSEGSVGNPLVFHSFAVL